jgi:DNA-binding transcriptional LysR family regulator
VRSVLVASPEYLARAGTPSTPEELAGHALIPHGDTSWELVGPDGRRASFRPRGRYTADSGVAELAGVAAGLGIAAMPAFLAAPAIARGEVVTLLDDWTIPEAGLYVVRPPPADPVPNKVRALTAILVERFGGDDWDGCPRRS